MIDNAILLAGACTIVLVGAMGLVALDGWGRRCLECRRRFAVFAFRRCRRHRVSR